MKKSPLKRKASKSKRKLEFPDDGGSAQTSSSDEKPLL